jgi:hypothetical protein
MMHNINQLNLDSNGNNHDSYHNNTSPLLTQKIQINNLEENSKTWKKLYDTVNPKWYQKPPFMFATGIITTLLLFKLF